MYGLPDGVFSASDRARIELGWRAKMLGEAAVELVRSLASDQASAGDCAKLARDFVDRASSLQDDAIVAERIRGASWADIARGLGQSDVDKVQARWEATVAAALARQPSGLQPLNTARKLGWVDAWSDKLPHPVAGFPKGALGRVLDASEGSTGRDLAEADRAFAGGLELATNVS
ncbi:hypothetical protein GCM10009639_55300 [Kitasatospora putterlickiae]|uniref:Uncharacterized protein n=1 Tax=Kitasatospora putterlickiae TaxID=221725 RepID=A0ABN1YG55_9ACTN